MKKDSLADKIAKKTFESDNFQKSWMVHKRAFAPILDPAFVEDYQTRIHLAAALNDISKWNTKGGHKKLKSIRDACVNDTDHAAWHFFMGLGYEMAGNKEQMYAFYKQAGEYGHRFYLPYLKIAKYAYSTEDFDTAVENYRKGIDCLEGEEPDERNKLYLASAYSNYATCLIMVHRLEDAEAALNRSTEILPDVSGRSATAAILYAAMGDRQKADAYLAETAKESQQLAEAVGEQVRQIFDGTHPHFSAKQEMD